MLILKFPVWRVQMLDQVISILVSFPNGARWNLRNIGGPAKRYEMWMAITSAMCEFAGLGRNRPLKDIIVCWTYTMTDPARGMGYARLYSSIGNPVQEAKAVARKVSGGSRKNIPAQTAEQTQAAKLKAWNHMVPREVILADYYAHLVTNVQGVLWEKVGAVLQTIFCEPATDISAAFLNIKSGQTAWDTALSTIVAVDKNPPRMPLVFVEFFENLLYFDSGVYPGGKIFVCESAL